MHHVGLFIQALIATEAAFSRIFALSTHIEGKVNAICSLHGQVHRQNKSRNHWKIQHVDGCSTATIGCCCCCRGVVYLWIVHSASMDCRHRTQAPPTTLPFKACLTLSADPWYKVLKLAIKISCKPCSISDYFYLYFIQINPFSLKGLWYALSKMLARSFSVWRVCMRMTSVEIESQLMVVLHY